MYKKYTDTLPPNVMQHPTERLRLKTDSIIYIMHFSSKELYYHFDVHISKKIKFSFIFTEI